LTLSIGLGLDLIVFLYQILPARKVPQILLTYKSQAEIKVGQVVRVTIRNKLVLGVIWAETKETADLENDKIKEISEVLVFELNSKQLEFLKLFTQNTFNSANFAIESFLQPFGLITKKRYKELETSKKDQNQIIDNSQFNGNNQELNREEGKVEFYLEKDILLRIRYIIRNRILNLNVSSKTSSLKLFYNILILFPERKMLDSVYINLLTNPLEIDTTFETNIQYNKYLADVSKSSKDTVADLIFTSYNNSSTPAQKPTLNLIFGTRSSIFLPYSSLSSIIFIDEANSMYIQEQNKLYYDTREAAILLSKCFQANLDFVSKLPSIRLYNFYPEKILDTFLHSGKPDLKKPLQIEITKRDSRFDHFDLISDALEQELNPSLD